MRMIIILLLLASCNSLNQGSIRNSEIKWDFYKKNIYSKFSNSNEPISFLDCDLIISKNNQIDSLDCYYGEFRFGDKLSSNHSDTGLSVPIVHTICYNKESQIIEKYMMSSAIVEVDLVKEETENKKLKKIIEERKTIDFLENFE